MGYSAVWHLESLGEEKKLLDKQKCNSETETDSVFLLGFSAAQVELFCAKGIQIKAIANYPLSQFDGLDLDDVELHDLSEIMSCNRDAQSIGSSMPDDLKIELRDRSFEPFRRHYNRISNKTHHKPDDWSDYDNMFFLAAQYFYDLLIRTKVRFVVMSYIPQSGAEIILYHLSKLLDTEVLIMHQAYFPNKFWIMKSIEDFGVFETTPGEGISTLPPIVEMPFYMQRGKKYSKLPYVLAVISLECLRLIAKFLVLQMLWDRRSTSRSLQRMSKCWEYNLYLGKPNLQAEQVVSLDCQFIYFPLHLQPELSTDTFGLEYGDQLLALESLSAAAPEGMLIYAKENPLQTRSMRSRSFYRRIGMLENVRYVSSSISSFDLIQRSACVATITGTAGWEAAALQKGVIIFGLAWYSSLPGVFKWQGKGTLEKALGFKHDREGFELAFEQITRKLYSGVLDDDYAEVNSGYDKVTEARNVVMAVASVLRAS